MDRCKQCKTKIIKFPLWTGQEFDEPFAWNKVLWLNWFKMDWTTVMWVVVFSLMIWGYYQDIEQFEEIIENPCGFCRGAINSCDYQDLALTNPNIRNLNPVVPLFNFT